MRISINLATRPFVEMRPLFAKLRLAMAVLSLLAIGLGIGLHFMNARARDAQAQMDALKAKTAAFQQQRQANEARMRQPQNMAVLERSQFLNAVFARKSFSWTAVMMDLEKVLPSGVQVTSIDPVITKDGEVNIRLRVSGDRDRAVQLVRNLETSQRFVAPRLSGEAAQTQEGNRAAGAVLVANTGAVEFDILSGYNPLPDVAKKGMNESGGKTGDHAAVASESSSGKHRLPTHKGSAEVQGGVAPPASRRTQTSPSHGGVR